jgi:phosphoribosylglycinamide formyltransferase 1
VTLPTVLFASGGGSNVRALLEAHGADSAWTPVLLVTDRDDAPVLQQARDVGLRHAVVPPGDDFEPRLLEVLAKAGGDGGPGLLVLAGYLRLVPPSVVRRWAGRILNVHPSLLPAFGGKGMYGSRIHAAVLASGVRVTGVTVHLVDERFDEGPILAQWPVAVVPGDTPDTLAARVLATEHRLYPVVVEHVAARLARPGPDAGRASGASEAPEAPGASDAPAAPEPPPPLPPSELSRHGLVFP